MENTDKKIERAIKNIVKREGFSNLSIEQICTESEIELSEFYNSYKDLDDALDKFVRLYDYWLVDLIKVNKKSLDIHQEFFKEFIDNIDSDKIMQAILLWSQNRFARRTLAHQILNAWHQADIFRTPAGYPNVDHKILFYILIGGIYFVNSQKELNHFLYSKIGKDSLIEVITWILDNLNFSSNKMSNKAEIRMKIKIAKKMLQANIDIKTISEVTGISESQFIPVSKNIKESSAINMRKRGRPPKKK